jgi:hypothetical protein
MEGPVRAGPSKIGVLRVDLIAAKPMRYKTRRLMPGDAFQADDRMGRILVKAKRARVDAAHAPAMRAAPDDLATLRAEYRAKFKKNPGPSWNAAILREKIAAA